MSSTRAEVTRRLSVSPDRVFIAFSTAELVARWLSPAPEIALHVLEYDFRVHGTYRFEYHVPGGQTMRVHGSFLKIVPPAEIVFSWVIEPPDEHAGVNSEVRVSIAGGAVGCVLTIVHERLDRPGAAERHSVGWAGALDRLEDLLR